MRKLTKIGINSHNSSFQTSYPKYILVYGFDNGESVIFEECEYYKLKLC